MMAVKKRLMAIVLAVVALGLTATGVVLAATDSNPTGQSSDPFHLNGYPPKSASLAISLRDGSGAGLHAVVNVNFEKNHAEAFVNFPLIYETVAVDVRAVGRYVYLRDANDASGSWIGARTSLPSLFGVALELTKPDIDLITGLNETKTKDGYLTTHTFTKDRIAVGDLTGGTSGTSTLGSLRWTIVTGSQGEVISSTLAVTSGHKTTTVSVLVLSYNQSADIVAPPAKDVHKVSVGSIEKLLAKDKFPTVLVPKSISSITGSTLS